MRFCYIDVANITKIIQITKAVNANCPIFNANCPNLTFVTNNRRENPSALSVCLYVGRNVVKESSD